MKNGSKPFCLYLNNEEAGRVGVFKGVYTFRKSMRPLLRPGYFKCYEALTFVFVGSPGHEEFLADVFRKYCPK